MLRACVWCVYHLPCGDGNHHRDKQVLLTHTGDHLSQFAGGKNNECETHLLSTIRRRKKCLAQNKQRSNENNKHDNETKRNETKQKFICTK